MAGRLLHTVLLWLLRRSARVVVVAHETDGYRVRRDRKRRCRRRHSRCRVAVVAVVVVAALIRLTRTRNGDPLVCQVRVHMRREVRTSLRTRTVRVVRGEDGSGVSCGGTEDGGLKTEESRRGTLRGRGNPNQRKRKVPNS